MAAVLTHVGKAIYNNVLAGTATWVKPDYVAWGTGAGTAGVGDTTLFTEASESREQGAVTVETVANTGDTYQVEATITATGSKTITNVGIFDASSSGRLFFKADFTGVPLNNNDTIRFILQNQIIDPA